MKRLIKLAAEDAGDPEPFVGGREAMVPLCIQKLIRGGYNYIDDDGGPIRYSD